MDFEVTAIEPVELTGPPDLLKQNLMSPYVWRLHRQGLSMLVRVVAPGPDPDGVTGRIWFGRGEPSGLRFLMDDTPLIMPGPGLLDIGGCEDPTVVPTDEGCVVYYTGVDDNGHGQMLYAEGPTVHDLTKQGVALASTKTEKNTKEATVERTSDGEWRLFYEYAKDDRSRIGLAFGDGPAGPWSERDDPIIARPEHWDSWHLSTGPLLMTDPKNPVMFYNGSDQDVRWQIGWVAFAADCSQVVARCDKPFITAPKSATDGRDICFSASVIQADDEIWIYYSQNDKTLLRATVRKTLPTPTEKS